MNETKELVEVLNKIHWDIVIMIMIIGFHVGSSFASSTRK